MSQTFLSFEQQARDAEQALIDAKRAAKEAAAKALGTGVWRNGIDWRDFEVCKDPESGAPELLLHDAAAERAGRLGLDTWSVSISHDRTHAVAFVVAT